MRPMDGSAPAAGHAPRRTRRGRPPPPAPRTSPISASGSVAQQLLRHAGHDHLPDAARDDEVERIEIGSDVEREAVECHPLLHVDADARDLAARRPHAGQPGVPIGLDPEPAERLDQDVLQAAADTSGGPGGGRAGPGWDIPPAGRDRERSRRRRARPRTPRPRAARAPPAGAAGWSARVPRPRVMTGGCSTSRSTSSASSPAIRCAREARAGSPAPRRTGARPDPRSRAGASCAAHDAALAPRQSSRARRAASAAAASRAGVPSAASSRR